MRVTSTRTVRAGGSKTERLQKILRGYVWCKVPEYQSTQEHADSSSPPVVVRRRLSDACYCRGGSSAQEAS
jgi:hypothetical protein